MRVAMKCLCVLLGSCVAAAQNLNSTQVELVVDCCSVLQQIYTFMVVEDEYKACQPEHCSSLKLMALFLHHTNTILQTESVLAGSPSGSSLAGVRAQGSDLVFSVPMKGMHVARLMVFTFFGRSGSWTANGLGIFVSSVAPGRSFVEFRVQASEVSSVSASIRSSCNISINLA
jgi:hypothetical protein